MRNGNVLNVLVISILLGFVYLGSIVAQDALKPNSESNTANALVGQLTCGLVCPTVENRIKALENAVTALQTTVNTQQTKIANLEAELAVAEAKLACVSVEEDPINGLAGPHVIFEGCNVHVQSGSGATYGFANGLGNLVVGYNEDIDTNDTSEIRDGSHNLIIGSEHTYSSDGGFAAGYNNTITGNFSSISGGIGNTANDFGSSVSGGGANTASENVSSVSGGLSNIASGEYSSVSGGFGNEASGTWSSVSGGQLNTANGLDSSVSGGANGLAPGDHDWVAGSLFEDQ